MHIGRQLLGEGGWFDDFTLSRTVEKTQKPMFINEYISKIVPEEFPGSGR